MKKIIYYTLISLFVLNAAILMTSKVEFTFWWWVGFLNVAGWGGYLIGKLLTYLKP